MSSLRLFAENLATMQRAYRLADCAVVADIETECAVVQDAGHQWYDLTLMLDQREHCAQVLDMVNESLCYGLARQLLVMHPTKNNLVRVIKVPT